MNDFWPQDEAGYLLNDASVDKIPSNYLPLIDDIKNIYLKYANDHIHSIYLFGSVVRGKAKPGLSDIDCLAILKEPINTDWMQDERQKLIAQYPIISSVVFDFELLDEVIKENEFSWTAFILSIGGICIYGQDLLPNLPRLKPSNIIANSELIQLEDNVKEAVEEIKKADTEEKVLYWCRRIMKNIIRDGFFLNMQKDNKFTPDVDLCFHQFIKHYPEQTVNMEKAVNYSKNPTTDKEELIMFLNSFGRWIIAEDNRWLDKYNPTRKNQLTI